MKNFLQKLRNKPEKVRQRILIGSLIVAIPLLLVIAGLLSNLYPNNENKDKTSTIGLFKGLFGIVLSEGR